MGKVIYIKPGSSWIDKAVLAYAEENNIADPIRLMMIKKTLETRAAKDKKHLATVLRIKEINNDT